MNCKNLLAIFSIALLSFGAMAEGISFEHLTLDEAIKKAKSEDKPIFIDVYATWCGPCKYLSREVFVDETLGAYMNANFINLKLDGEEGDGDYLMAEFGLDAFPTMLYLSSDKEELHRIVGAVSAEEILDASKGVIDPTTTEAYQLQSRYDGGERGRSFMQTYIANLVNNEGEFDAVADEYISLYPDLDLDDADDFLIFCIGVNDLEDPLNTKFFQNIEEHNAAYPELTQAKFSILIFSACEAAHAADDKALVDQAVGILIPPLNKILEEEVSEDELRELMLESVAEM